MSSPVRVLVADDHWMFRQAVESWLSEQGFVVQGASTLDELDAALNRGGIDAALVDLSWGDEGAVTARLPAWYKRHPSCRVIILTAHDDWYLGQELIRGGARGFLGKRSDFSALFEAIHAVVRGETYFDTTIHPRPKRSPAVVAPGLPSIRFRIVEFLACGWSRKEIAKALNITTKTVDYHIAKVKFLYGIGRWQRTNWKAICATLSSQMAAREEPLLGFD
jgi:DNA-binding NarL/FixJ family response regulator